MNHWIYPPTYLSLLLSGHIPWRGKLKERYLELVNTFVNTQEVNNLQTNGSKLYSIPVENAAEGGTPTHTSLQTTDFK